MYHISDDSRARMSAELICNGLTEVLKRKKLIDVTVSETVKAAGVGRATFYRLFDIIDDVLVYQCDVLFENTMQSIQGTNKNYIENFMEQCIKHRPLIRAIAQNNRIDLIYAAHKKYEDLLRNTILQNLIISERQYDFVLAFLTAGIASFVMVLGNNPERFTVSDLMNDLKVSMGSIEMIFSKE